VENNNAPDSIPEEISPIIKAMGYEIVELSVQETKNSMQVRSSIYSPNGVSAEDCAEVYRTIFPRLEVLIENKDISLEIMSPGVNRRIKDNKEYQIFIKKGIKILTQNSNEWYSGIIDYADENIVKLKQVDESIQEIRLENIKKARLDYKQEVR